METNIQNDGLSFTPKQKSKTGKTLLWIASFAVVLGLAGTGLYFFVLNNPSGNDAPPSLQFEGGQGFIGTGAYLQFDDNDIALAAGKNFPKEIPVGFQVFYSQNDTNLKEVINSIKPEKDLNIFFAIYNSTSKKFDVFPKGPYVNTNLIDKDKLELFAIEANKGFFMIGAKYSATALRLVPAKFYVSNSLSLYTKIPQASYLSDTSLTTLMNSFASVPKNSAGDDIYDWKLIVGDPEKLLNVCGNRIASIYVSETPDSNGIKFKEFSTATINGYAIWLKVGGLKDSCILNYASNGGSEDHADETGDDSGDDTVITCANDTLKDNTKFEVCKNNSWYKCELAGTIISSKYACFGEKWNSCTVPNSIVNSSGLKCTAAGWIKVVETLDITQEISEAQSYYDLSLGYVASAEVAAAEVETIYSDAQNLLSQPSAFNVLKNFGKASLLAVARIEIPIQPVIERTDGVRTDIMTTNQAILQGSLNLEKTLQLNSVLLNYKNLMSNVPEDVLKSILYYKNKTRAEANNAKTESQNAKTFLDSTKNSQTKETARFNRDKVKLAKDAAFFNSDNAIKNKDFAISALEKLKLAIEAKALAQASESATVDNTTQDPRFSIDPQSINAGWNEYTKCIANKGIFDSCKINLISGLPDIKLQYANGALVGCYHQKITNYGIGEVYQCLNDVIDIIEINFIIETVPYTKSQIYSDNDRFLISVDGENKHVYICNDEPQRDGIIIDNSFYCTGAIWIECSGEYSSDDSNKKVQCVARQSKWEKCDANNQNQVKGNLFCNNGAIWVECNNASSINYQDQCYAETDQCEEVNAQDLRWECFGGCDNINEEEDKNLCWFNEGACSEIGESSDMYLECNQEYGTCIDIDIEEERWECFGGCEYVEDDNDIIACYKAEDRCAELEDDDQLRWECFDGCENIDDEDDQDNCWLEEGSCEEIVDDNIQYQCSGDCMDYDDEGEQDQCWLDEGACEELIDDNIQYQCSGDCMDYDDEGEQDQCWLDEGACEEIVDDNIQYQCSGDCMDYDDMALQIECFEEVGDCDAFPAHLSEEADLCYLEADDCANINGTDIKNQCILNVYDCDIDEDDYAYARCIEEAGF